MRETLENGGAGGQPIGSPNLRVAVGNRWVQDPDFYYDLLAPEADHLDVWTTEYQHVLTGDDAVLEWVTGTGLRPILNGLEDEERETYLAEYRRRLNAVYPKRPDGVTLYPFRRLFFVAIRR
jgi:trans-aconitate 2-methyltransferase